MANYSTINSIPKMTSYTTPSGIVTASTESNKTSYPAWKAFDGSNISGGWNSSTKIDWLAYEFPEPIIIGGYSIDSGTVTVTYVPKAWTFEGTNDNVNWDILDTRTNEINWGYKETRYYKILNFISYKKYRINITDTNGSSYIYLSELSMYELIPTIKYLIKDKNNVIYTYDEVNNIILQSPSQQLNSTNFKENGFIDPLIITEEQWNNTFSSKTGLQLLKWTDDTSITQSNVTCNVEPYSYKPIDQFGENKILGVSFSTTDNKTFTVDPLTNVPFKQNSVVCYKDGIEVTPDEINYDEGIVVFNTEQIGIITFDYTYIIPFDILLYKPN